MTNGKRGYEPVRPRALSPGAVLFILALVAVVIVTAIYYYIRSSEPIGIAESFIRRHPAIRATVGDVEECKLRFPFSVTTTDNRGNAELNFKVKGKTGSTRVYVRLAKSEGRWRITLARYEDRQGLSAYLVGGGIKTPAEGTTGIEVPKAVRWHLQQGQLLFQKKDYEGAIAAYDLAIQADPENVAAYYWRGRAHLQNHQKDQAVADLKKVVEIRPNNVNAHRWLGWIYSQDNRNAECAASLTKAIELQPSDAWSHYNRGRCFQRLGRVKDAREDAKRSCELGLPDGCRIYKELSGG